MDKSEFLSKELCVKVSIILTDSLFKSNMDNFYFCCIYLKHWSCIHQIVAPSTDNPVEIKTLGYVALYWSSRRHVVGPHARLVSNVLHSAPSDSCHVRPSHGLPAPNRLALHLHCSLDILKSHPGLKLELACFSPWVSLSQRGHKPRGNPNRGPTTHLLAYTWLHALWWIISLFLCWSLCNPGQLHVREGKWKEGSLSVALGMN